jgi:hypothetical protein
MPSADQVPVKSPHSRDAVAHVGCPDRRIDRLCITCCSPSQPCMGQLLSSLIFDLFHLLFDASGDISIFLAAARSDGQGGRGHRERDLMVTSTAAGSVERFLQCGQTTTIRGGLPSGAEIAPQPCIRSIREDRNHDAVMGIGGEAPGRRAHSSQRLGSHGWRSGHRHLGLSSADPCRGRQGSCSVVLSSRVVAHDAGRKTTPCGISPFVTRRQRAMSSLRASATIIVLRVLPRPSAVRA